MSRCQRHSRNVADPSLIVDLLTLINNLIKNMTNSAQELKQLQELIDQHKPKDVLQFCADYFNHKLKSQRQNLWNQQQKAKQLGIVLFPEVNHMNMNHQSTEPKFKSPFGDNDPHGSFDPHSQSSQQELQQEQSSPPPQHQQQQQQPGSMFKSDFKVSAKDSSNEDKLSQLPKKTAIPSLFNAHRRTSVSAEALNPDKFKSDLWKPPVNDLTSDQRIELLKNLSNNFLFKQLDDDSKKTVIAALQKKTFDKGYEIITQGDQGDFFYIIESGTVDFYVNNAKVSLATDGGSFGELALMYNSPRAATVIAVTPVTTWALDRLTFRRILLEGTFNRRLMYEDFLKDVPILSGLTNQERSKLADALSTQIYHKGDEIVTEGEQGENFYFIESGNCQVSSKKSGEIVKLTKGDYFGEIALLNDLPRQATVTALDTVIVAMLGKSGFERLLGPAIEVLKQKDPSKK